MNFGLLFWEVLILSKKHKFFGSIKLNLIQFYHKNTFLVLWEVSYNNRVIIAKNSLKRLFKLQSHKFWLKFVVNQVKLNTKFTFFENRPQNWNINKNYSFYPIFLKFWYKSMPTIVYKWLKCQAIWIICSGDINSFMHGTYKKSPCIGGFGLNIARWFDHIKFAFYSFHARVYTPK